MDKELISYDEYTGLRTYSEFDNLTGKIIVSYQADATPVIEENKAWQNDNDITKQGIKDGFWRYASFPVMVQLDLLINHGIDVWKQSHGERISKILEDPQYRYLKTTTKHHKFK